MKPAELSPWNGPGGRGGTPAACWAAATCAGSGPGSRDVALELVRGALGLVERRLALVAGGVELALPASSSLRVRASSALRAAISSRSAVTRLTCRDVVAKVADAADHVGVLVSTRLRYS